MTKNNEIPIEVKKPFETVQELKDEYKIPSFEEFMKDYKIDENLNYDDLKGSDIGTQKGYGPCPVCNDTEITVEFRLGCPSCSNSTPTLWHHVRSGCENSRMLITNKGWLSCGGCGTGYNMSNWRFSCSNHPGDYRSMSEDCWNESMARALMLGSTNSAIKRLSMYVASHPEKFGFK